MRPIYDAKFRGEIRKRMSPPSRETVTEISGIQVLAVKRFIAGDTYKTRRGLHNGQLAIWRQGASAYNLFTDRHCESKTLEQINSLLETTCFDLD